MSTTTRVSSKADQLMILLDRMDADFKAGRAVELPPSVDPHKVEAEARHTRRKPPKTARVKQPPKVKPVRPVERERTLNDANFVCPLEAWACELDRLERGVKPSRCGSQFHVEAGLGL